MWRYTQATGIMTHNDKFVWTGYSGHGAGLNNPLMQADARVGPIPQGLYDIGPPVDHTQLGPFALPLTPRPGTNTYGRSGFFLHGVPTNDAGHDASLGCIAKSPIESRQEAWNSGDRVLWVV